MPKPTSQMTPKTERQIRGQLFTLSAAPRSAAFFTGSRRRSAHSYCVARIATAPKVISSPGPGSGIAAMPTSSRTQPTVTTANFLAARFTTTAYECA